MDCKIQYLGRQDYQPIYEAMQNFTKNRDKHTVDEIWVLEHPPVFTLGQAGDESHLLQRDTQIPLVHINRGGQITYHGPGQVVVYLLLDLKRRGIYVKELVHRIEASIIHTLADYAILSERKSGAPGIYLSESAQLNPSFWGAKIAALGLKVSQHCCYHGLALNVNMDLIPFEQINPCGYAGLRTVDMATIGIVEKVDNVAIKLVSHLEAQLNQ